MPTKILDIMEEVIGLTEDLPPDLLGLILIRRGPRIGLEGILETIITDRHQFKNLRVCIFILYFLNFILNL